MTEDGCSLFHLHNGQLLQVRLVKYIHLSTYFLKKCLQVVFVSIIAKNSKVVEMQDNSVFMAPILEVNDLLKKRLYIYFYIVFLYYCS